MSITPSQKSSGKRERKRKHRMLELDHIERQAQAFPE
jgi:hypothetical protein